MPYYRDKVYPRDMPVESKLGYIRLLSTSRTTTYRATYPKDMRPEAEVEAILFSHGLGGSRDDYPDVARDWAEHGYVVIQPDMIDSPYYAGKGARDEWKPRAQETVEMIDNIQMLVPNGVVVRSVGVAGHSAGGESIILALGGKMYNGQSIQTILPRAGLLLSPPGRNNTLSKTDNPYANFRVPLYTITGTKDVGDPEPGQEEPQSYTWRLNCYNSATVPSFYSVYQDGDHGHGWPFGKHGRTDEDQKIVELDQYLAWWGWNLRGDRQAAKYVTQGLWAKWGAPVAYSHRNWPKPDGGVPPFSEGFRLPPDSDDKEALFNLSLFSELE